jgi:acyl-CoA reductase-like NAD-dependent aldehyde dehydrogenase
MTDQLTKPDVRSQSTASAIVSPLTGQPARARLGRHEMVEVRPTQPGELPEVYDRADQAQREWGKVPLDDRIALIERVYRKLYEHRHEVADVINQATGKSVNEALLTEVHNTLDACAFLVKHARRILSPRRLPAPFLIRMMGYKAELSRKPHGVVTKISAFNYPFKFAFDAASFAVAAGNAIVVKPDWSVSHPATLVEWLFEEAGAPRNLVQTIYGKGLGRYVVQQRMDFLSFTGGTDTAQQIWRNLPRPIPISFELGGTDPFIVLPDADLDVVARALLWGRLIAAGQTCVASKRAIIVDDPPGRINELTQRMIRLLGSMRLAEKNPDEYDVGPVISSEAARNLADQAARAKAAGAECLLETIPGRADRPSLWVIPKSARANQPLLDEEFFGPVFCLIPVADEEEATQLANQQQFGLGSSVFGRDRRRLRQMADRLEAGMKWLNNVVTTTGSWPWTGCKASGPGHSLGEDGLLAMTRPEVTVTYRGHDLMSMPHIFPYDRDHRAMVEAMITACHAPGALTRLGGWLKMLGPTVRRLKTIRQFGSGKA